MEASRKQYECNNTQQPKSQQSQKQNNVVVMDFEDETSRKIDQWDAEKYEKQQQILKRKQQALWRELKKSRESYTRGKNWIEELQRSLLGTLQDNEKWLSVAQFAFEQCETANALNAQLVEENRTLQEENLLLKNQLDLHQSSHREAQREMASKQNAMAMENERLWRAYEIGQKKIKNMQHDQMEAFNVVELCVKSELQEKDRIFELERKRLEKRLEKYETKLKRMKRNGQEATLEACIGKGMEIEVAYVDGIPKEVMEDSQKHKEICSKTLEGNRNSSRVKSSSENKQETNNNPCCNARNMEIKADSKKASRRMSRLTDNSCSEIALELSSSGIHQEINNNLSCNVRGKDMITESMHPSRRNSTLTEQPCLVDLELPTSRKQQETVSCNAYEKDMMAESQKAARRSSRLTEKPCFEVGPELLKDLKSVPKNLLGRNSEIIEKFSSDAARQVSCSQTKIQKGKAIRRKSCVIEKSKVEENKPLRYESADEGAGIHNNSARKNQKQYNTRNFSIPISSRVEPIRDLGTDLKIEHKNPYHSIAVPQHLANSEKETRFHNDQCRKLKMETILLRPDDCGGSIATRLSSSVHDGHGEPLHSNFQVGRDRNKSVDARLNQLVDLAKKEAASLLEDGASISSRKSCIINLMFLKGDVDWDEVGRELHAQMKSYRSPIYTPTTSDTTRSPKDSIVNGQKEQKEHTRSETPSKVLLGGNKSNTPTSCNNQFVSVTDEASSSDESKIESYCGSVPELRFDPYDQNAVVVSFHGDTVGENFPQALALPVPQSKSYRPSRRLCNLGRR